jgi:hypothetical protein
MRTLVFVSFAVLLSQELANAESPKVFGKGTIQQVIDFCEESPRGFFLRCIDPSSQEWFAVKAVKTSPEASVVGGAWIALAQRISKASAPLDKEYPDGEFKGVSPNLISPPVQRAYNDPQDVKFQELKNENAELRSELDRRNSIIVFQSIALAGVFFLGWGFLLFKFFNKKN